MGIDEAGKHGGAGEVDHGRAFRERPRGGVAHGLDAAAAHEDELVAAGGEGPAVEEAAGAYHDERIGGPRQGRESRHETESDGNGDGRCAGRRLEPLRHGQTRAGIPAAGPT